VTFTDLTEFAGFVVRDAEKKISKKGTPYFEITVGWKRDDETRWVKTRVFDRDAIPQSFVKGTQVLIKGVFNNDEWTGKDGVKRTGWSCMAKKASITKRVGDD
jgi:single-stranded DNA-binding protein